MTFQIYQFLEKSIWRGQQAMNKSYAFIAIDSASLESASTLARSLALYFRFRGLVLSLYPQHGHQRPSHLMNISQIWQRLCPEAYLPVPTGF